MPVAFIRLVLVRPGYVYRSIDQPFFAFVIETEKPRGVMQCPLADHVVEMSLIPTFLSFILPSAIAQDTGAAYPQQYGIGKGGDPGLARGFFHPPLEKDELPVITQLGIDQG